jgi:hypothetical protein
VPDPAFGAQVRYAVAEWALAGPHRARLYCHFRRGFSANIVGPQSRIVIEGYPRSANSYAVAAFLFANGRVPLGHHLHSPVNVELGVARKLPVVLLVRRPLDAIASLLLRAPAMSPRVAIGRYIRFHRRLVPLLSEVVVAPYEVVIADFGAVIDEVNRRFGTAFQRYERTPEHEEALRWHIDWSGRVHGDDELAVGRPSSLRAERKPAVIEAVERRREELAAAEQLYEAVLAHAGLVP